MCIRVCVDVGVRVSSSGDAPNSYIGGAKPVGGTSSHFMWDERQSVEMRRHRRIMMKGTH